MTPNAEGNPRPLGMRASTTRSTRDRHTLLALDPGIRVSGAALFRGRELIGAALVRNPIKIGNGVAACVGVAGEIVTWARYVLHIHVTTRERQTVDQPREIDELIAEWPRVYATRLRERKTKEDPNDLPPLAGIGAALGALLRPAVLNHVAPSDWKGQVPGDSFLDRIVKRLTPEERALVPSGGGAHNAIDAIGVGLYHLGRLERERVIAR